MIRGILLDIDGVLHLGMQPIPGAAQTLQQLRQQGYHICFVTNTTIHSQTTLAQRLQQIGLPVSQEDLLTAPVATAEYIRQHHAGQRCWVLTKGNTAADFAGIELVDAQSTADVVVIGGAEELLTYDAMNHAFRQIMNGATLLAMHKNLYWKTATGLQLDSGPFVAALELASGQKAVVLGKPDRAFFEQALRKLGVTPIEAIMVGDDIENDVGAAQNAGMQGILVCTGKHNANSPLLKRIHPTAILPSLAELPAYLSTSSATP